jgi:hypothetical protein
MNLLVTWNFTGSSGQEGGQEKLPVCLRLACNGLNMSRGRPRVIVENLPASENSYHWASKSLEKNPWFLEGLAKYILHFSMWSLTFPGLKAGYSWDKA